MARRLSDLSAAARRLRAAQRGLVRFLLRDVQAAMPRLDPADPASAPLWIADVGLAVGRYARMSAELSARAYEAERADAGARTRLRVPLAAPPPDEQVERSLRWAAHDVWAPTAPSPDRRPAFSEQIAAGLLRQAAERTEAVTSKLVLDTGRSTVVDAVDRDPDATGWYRSAAVAACPFCRLMAARGAVYKDRSAAGAEANERFEGDGLFKFHDNCQCVAMPVLRGDTFELSPDAARWDDAYERYAAGHSGDQLRRFRIAMRLLDAGRTPTEADFAA